MAKVGAKFGRLALPYPPTDVAYCAGHLPCAPACGFHIFFFPFFSVQNVSSNFDRPKNYFFGRSKFALKFWTKKMPKNDRGTLVERTPGLGGKWAGTMYNVGGR